MKTFVDCVDRAQFAARVVHRPAGDHFRCRCGRLVPADMMLDLSPASGAIPGPLDKLAQGDRYRCDGCCRRWVAAGAIPLGLLRSLTEQPPPRSERQVF